MSPTLAAVRLSPLIRWPDGDFNALAEHPASDAFLNTARHAEHPAAFSRRRKLPLTALVTTLVSGMCKSVQVGLDGFFSSLKAQASLVRHLTSQAFAQARAKLAPGALPALNDHLIALAEEAGFVPRWHGLRRIAVDGSCLRHARGRHQWRLCRGPHAALSFKAC